MVNVWKKCTSYSYNQHAKVEGTQKQRRESKPCQVPTENPAISLEFGIAFSEKSQFKENYSKW